MKKRIFETLWPGDADVRRAKILTAMIIVQFLCATFFLIDVVLDFDAGGHPTHLALETFVAVVLCAGIWVLMIELRALLVRMEQARQGLRVARGELAQVIDGFFDRWGLTGAERDVGLLILKGFDNENIARIRGRAVGTVRAQSASIYAKAGVDGRAQLISVFFEELLANDTPTEDARQAASI